MCFELFSVAYQQKKGVEYLMDPLLGRYTEKLYSSLLSLHEIKESTGLIGVISSLSILISNGRVYERFETRWI